MIKVGKQEVAFQENMTISDLMQKLNMQEVYTYARIIQKDKDDIRLSFVEFKSYTLPDNCEVSLMMVAGG